MIHYQDTSGCDQYVHSPGFAFREWQVLRHVAFLLRSSPGLCVRCYDRRKFRSQTSGNMDRWKKRRWEKAEKRKSQKRKSQKRKRQKKENPGARKGRKVAKHCVVPCFSNVLWLRRVAVGSLKRRVRSHLVCWEIKCMPLWREADFEVKMANNTSFSGHFLHAAVAWSSS